MIYGIGADIVQVSRMKESLDRFGERFAQRILAEPEIEEFHGDARPAHFLAKRFAAKEAVLKALGAGFRDGIRLSDIQVTHDSAGKPGLSYSGATAAMVEQCGVEESHLSLADEKEYAVAFVILLRGTVG